MKSKTDEARAHTYKQALTNTHPHQPRVLHQEHRLLTAQLLPEEQRDSGAASPLQPLNFRNRGMNKQKINVASWCEDAGLFSQLQQMLLLVSGAYQPFAEPPDIQH